MSIYFIQATQSRKIKIGFSRNPLKRLLSLQGAHHEHLTIIAVFYGNKTEEQRLHRAFSKHQIRGEWFHPADEILTLVARGIATGVAEVEVVEAAPSYRCRAKSCKTQRARTDVVAALDRTNNNVQWAANTLGLCTFHMQHRMRELGLLAPAPRSRSVLHLDIDAARAAR